MKLGFLLCSFVVCCLISSKSLAEQSDFQKPDQADLYREDLFDAAADQISNMSLAELDELRAYLASCGTRAGGDIKAFFCERSARAYSLKYGQDKPVDRLVQAMASVEAVIELVDHADEQGELSAEQTAMKTAFFKDLDRYILIKKMMEFSTRKRYKKLINTDN